MEDPKYYLGCPVWACEGWVGHLYRSKSRREWLSEYSSQFNAVEGNSTFYGMPTEDTVRRWASETKEGFRFVLKFPREITHEAQLRNAGPATRVFLRLLNLLAEADRLGPTFLQLPPSFSGKQIGDLGNYLSRLPRDLPFAVEVRHLAYFDRGEGESQLIDLLTGLGMDYVIFDSRALFATAPADEFEKQSQSRKPRTPFRTTVTGNHPVVRFVGRNDLYQAEQQIDEWARIVAGWINDGLQPYLFTHSPNDFHAPEFAMAFHRRLRSILPDLPPRSLPKFEAPLQQRQLF